jgi:hypothetical protein
VSSFPQEKMGEILIPYPSVEMAMHPVSSWENSPDVDEERLIQLLESNKHRPEHFY